MVRVTLWYRDGAIAKLDTDVDPVVVEGVLNVVRRAESTAYSRIPVSSLWCWEESWIDEVELAEEHVQRPR